MKYLQIFIFLNLNVWSYAFSQNCGFTFQYDNKLEHITEGYVQNLGKQLSSRAIVKIPVVVHVVWKNADENISDAQIQSQIDVLNADFRRKNADFKDVPGSFKSVAADVEIEFCLASKDTLGQLTSGITRRQTTFSEIGSSFSNNKRRIYYNNLGGVNNWQPNSYLNIWVCNMGSVYGYTTSLKEALIKPEEDGIIVDYRAFGTIGSALSNASHNKGRTATHEIGHYLNLLHIWGTDDSCNDDDLVSDTPLQATAHLGCPPFPQISCGSGSMYMNFMDFTDDNCMGLFTVGQKARMIAALNEFRPSLLRGSGCTPTSTQEIDFQWLIYPNPANDFINIRLKGIVGSGNVNLRIINSVGAVVLEQKFPRFLNPNGSKEELFSIPISHYSNGIYVVSIIFNDRILTKKIVVNY